MARTLDIIGEIVKQAVSQAVAAKPKKVDFKKDADGLIESAEAT